MFLVRGQEHPELRKLYTKLGTKVVKKNVKNEKLFFFIHPKEVKY